MLRAHLDADLEGALVDWRQYRRRKRIADIHWIDALYQAYLTGIVGLVAIAVAASFVGDEELSAAQVRQVLHDGPGWVGGLAAFAIALGLRSGSRGGPLALERAEVRHVLLAPVDRTSALRAPAIRQARFLLFVGVVVGGIAGYLATRRLPGTEPAWIATGALTGATLVGLALGSALVASGIRLPRWLATLVGVALLAGSVAHGVGLISTSPTAGFGALALWAVRFDAMGLAPVVLSAALLAAGLTLLGRGSLEAAERRSSLVGQLRFAATMQDLRTVIVLRRQLAMELPRLRPWATISVRGTGRWPIFVRGLRGVLRWPAARLARLGLLAVVAGVALRGAWAGTTPLIVLAGMAMFLAGLDAVEPLAQEVDHPTRRDASPLPAAAIHLGHIPMAVITMLITAALAAAVAAAAGPGRIPGELSAVLALPLAIGGVAGALVSLLGSSMSTGDTWSLAPPEAQGMRLAFRTVWPPALATFGAAPVLLARSAEADSLSPVAGAWPLVLGVGIVFVLVVGWVRVRDDIGAWFKESMAAAEAQQKLRARTDDDD